jgi:hypothetical protein
MKIIRAVTGIVAGLITWFLVATAGDRLLRVSWPGYAQTEILLKFTIGMMAVRLVLGAFSSVCAGFVVAWVTKSIGMAAKVLGIVLVAMFIPVHYGLWDKFPVWYHLTFLVSLLPLTLVGATLKAQPDVGRLKGPAPQNE